MVNFNYQLPRYEIDVAAAQALLVQLPTGGLGNWYLGAVPHIGPDGLMGLTLVDVDNR